MKAVHILRDLFYMKDILIVVLTPILLLPFILVVVGNEAKCAYCVIIMAVYWISEALPIAVTSLLPVFLFPLVGVLSVAVTAKEYINETNMLFIGGVIVAAAIEHWNIHKRIALRILLLVGAEPRWLMFGLMAPTWFLSMWISNTATTAMMVPIGNAILMQLKDTEKKILEGNINESLELDEILTNEITVKNDTQTEKFQQNGTTEIGHNEIIEELHNDNKAPIDTSNDAVEDESFKRLCKGLSLAIAYSSSVGGIASLTGTGTNLIMKGQLDIVYSKYGITKNPITFASWMAFGVPLGLILFFVIWIWLQIIFLRCNGCCKVKDNDKDKRVKAAIRLQYEQLGAISFGQGAVICLFILLAILWIARDLGGEYGWGYLFKDKYVTDAVPAVFIACILFIFPSTWPKVFCARRRALTAESLKPLISWRDAADKIPWGVVLLLGGGFAMAKASQDSGLSKWIGVKLSVLDFLEPWILNLVLVTIMAALTEVTSNSATCTLMMPILANLAIELHQHPMYLMFPTGIAVSFAFMLPVATPPNAIVFSYGYVRVIDMVKAGFVLNIVGVLVLVGMIETLGNHLFKFHEIPAEILASYNATN